MMFWSANGFEIALHGTPQEVFDNPQNERTRAFLRRFSRGEGG